jgi:hypothetical protein
MFGLVAIAVMLTIPATGSASTGAITTATVDPTWTMATITGSVTISPELQQPVVDVLVQPALPSYTCTSDEWSDNDPNTRPVGGATIVNGVGQINIVDAPALTGVYGQRVCVLVVGTESYIDPVCTAQYNVLYDWWLSYGGPQPSPCQPTDHVVSEIVATAPLTVAQPPTPTPAPPAPTPTPTLIPTPTLLTAMPPKPPVPVATRATTTATPSAPSSCVVPQLRGMTLTRAKTALARARCTLGRVSRPRHVKPHQALHVIAQSPGPGARRNLGVRVNVTLG